MTRVATSPDSRARRTAPPRRGYVLLLVLLVLAIAAAALAGVCRMSLSRSLQARRAEEDLRRRWAVLTCRSVLLPKAEAVLAQAERAGAPASAEVRRDVRLGGQEFTLVFGDEQAKANVNLLYREGGAPAAERAIRQLVQTADVSVELRPVAARVRANSDDEPPPAFESFGQVFAGASPARLINGERSTIAPPASVLTCWGDGSLHFRRAPAAAVREVCARHAGAALSGRLIQIRDKQPGMEVSQALDQVKLSEKAREALEELLVDDSACHSLWIITRSGGRSVYDLAVLDQSSQDGGQPALFSW